MKLFVTGGAGFIGSNYVRWVLANSDDEVTVYDALTYAGNLATLEDVKRQYEKRFRFVHANICDLVPLEAAMAAHDAVVHFAAESHVDRSIDGPGDFIQTNVVGTFTLLQETLRHWHSLDRPAQAEFRFHHISTDEVFGSLGSTGLFSEDTAYAPNSPYSASKAASDHLVRAWYETYGLPCLVTNCSNNYGPYQFPEKLIPHMIIKGLAHEPLPVYGDGKNIRDWLYVEDHVAALVAVLERGRIGETYNVGGRNERTNLQVVETICALLDRAAPSDRGPRHRTISFVKDRPGHDRRYGIDAAKIERELGWRAAETFETGLAKTVTWYLENRPWWQNILDNGYKVQRVGLSHAPA